MSRVLLDGRVLTREAMVEALVADHGGEATAAMLAGRTCPEFDVADDLRHEDARRIYGWLRARLRSRSMPELKYAAVETRTSVFREAEEKPGLAALAGEEIACGRLAERIRDPQAL